ncbi:hypothetical protein FHS19_006865 [Paenibacillus rhizosphaerae]|uniref:Lipoprotein n=1 Tax=Paenibacillus rhizosphaerae TaxID=297318 RepID=A0A839U3A8_9BACL|nr:hypothetical protein [Paenibacillus rhizosphaerae]MBB3132138.1 hypothetical protein [Paenibacillus rhizosphaerae]
MKKVGLLLTIFVLALVGCTHHRDGSYTSASSYIKVIDKETSSDYKEAWIMAYNPYNSEEKDPMKIIVREPMVWNLIEKDKEYFSTYSQEKGKPWVLEQISYPGDEKGLR